MAIIHSGHHNRRGTNHADARLDAGEVRNLSQLPLAVGRRDHGPTQRRAAAAWLFCHGRDHRPAGNGRGHAAIWNEFTDQPFELPPDKPLTIAAYQVEPFKTAYVEPIAVADRLPDIPLFLFDKYNVNVPSLSARHRRRTVA